MPPRRAPQARQLTDADQNAISRYTPKKIDAARWTVIADFCREVASAYAPWTSTETKIKDAIHQIAAYVYWGHFGANLPLDRSRLFNADVVNYWAANALGGYTDGSRATKRSFMMKVSDCVSPHARRTIVVEQIGKNPARSPYKPEEIEALRYWAAAQSSAYRRHAAWALLAFGLGAGLRAGELVRVTREDVTEDDDGVLVRVTDGPFPRSVPVRAAWEDHAVLLAGAVAPGSLVFLPDGAGGRPNRASEFVNRSDQKPKVTELTVAKMRATWIVELLNAQVSAAAMVMAAGVKGYTAMDRYLPYVDEAALPVVREQLRIADNASGREQFWKNHDYIQARRAARRRARIERGDIRV